MNINQIYEDKYSQILKNIVLAAVSNRSCKVFLFGSRATGTIRWGSDFDIGIEGLLQADYFRIKQNILEQIEESIIPWHVDIVNFNTVDSSFRVTAQKEYILWKSV